MPGLHLWAVRIDTIEIIKTLWLLWGVYWAVSALGRGPVRRRQPSVDRLAHILLMGVGFVFFYSADPRFGSLNARFMPPSDLADGASGVLTAFGLGFSALARHHLGRNWSAEVTIRQDHALIRTGPYARIRHPIYTGLLIALLGAVLALGVYRAIVGFAIIAIGFYLKSRQEERFLAEEFGEEFERHRHRTGLFLPRLRRPAS
jgi:protein-S-isoprenylcysteine O-methyltransferase Ste14